MFSQIAAAVAGPLADAEQAITLGASIAPAAPISLRAAGVSSSEVDLAWSDGGGGATSYQVQRAGSDGQFAQIAQVSAGITSFQDTTVVADTDYTYRVSATNASGTSPFSATVAATTLPPHLATPITTLPPLPDLSTPGDAHVSQVVMAGTTGFFFGYDESQSHWELWKTDGTPLNTTMVKDFGFGTSLANVGAAGNQYCFTVTDTSGSNLWVSDGTQAGTISLGMLSPGAGTSFGGTLFMPVKNSDGTYALWKTDGTPAGTTALHTFTVEPTNLFAFNGSFYFVADGGSWTSDGTPAGTVQESTFDDAQFGTPGAVVAGSYIYYVVNGALYRTDGTAAGTLLLKDGGTGLGAVQALTAVGNKAAFATSAWNANITDKDTTLWVTDGTISGTQPVHLFLGTASTGIGDPAAAGNLLYLTVPNPGGGLQLWKTDLTPANTALVTTTPGFPSQLSGCNNVVTFKQGISEQLWSSNGTAEGTQQISDVGPEDHAANPDWFTNVNSTTYFISAPGSGRAGGELWATDGTPAGTVRLFAGTVSNPISFNGMLYFDGYDSTHGAELWKTDGTAAGTVLVDDIDPGGPGSSPQPLAVLGNQMFFAANQSLSNVDSYELWATDGTASGTHRVATSSVSIFPNDETQSTEWAASGGYFYFISNVDSQSGLGGTLWRTDGTTTTQITGLSNVESAADVSGKLFVTAFAGGPGMGGAESLYAVTAQATTATLLATPSSSPYNGMVGSLTNINGTLYFTAPYQNEGIILWKSDGTTAGTVPIVDPVNDDTVGISSGRPWGITAVGGSIYFLTSETWGGCPIGAGELWVTDGTPAGSHQVRNIFLLQYDAAPPRPIFAAAVAGFFVYSDGEHVWRSDGTFAGTVQVDDIGTASDATHSPALFGGAPDLVQANQLFYSGAVSGGGRDLRVASFIAPAAPTALTASIGSSGSISFHGTALAAVSAQSSTPQPVVLSWNEQSTNQTGFVVDRSTDAGFSTVERFFVPASQTTFDDTTAIAENPYYYRVRAVNAGGSSNFSNSSAIGTSSATDTLFQPTDGPAPNQQNAFDQQIVNAGGVELGMKFTRDVAGTVTGVRFYKGTQDSGPHTGELWSNTGQLLATATFTDPSASGWQQVNFPQPVSISANATYVVSYHSTSGYLSYTPGALSTSIDNAPLHALASSTPGGNDVYVYGASAFPNVFNGQSPNYWVDAVFTPSTILPPPPPPPPAGLTLFAPSAGPDQNGQNVFDQQIVNAGGVELGMKFTSDVAGTVSGVRFYKDSQDTGAQTGELWSSTGQLLATATFTNETASGWQQVNFSSPVSIAADTSYVVSYHTTSGYIAYTPQALSSSIDNAPLHAPSSGTGNGNDVYVYGSSAFPNVFNGQSPNYWVDVAFSPSTTSPPAPVSLFASSSAPAASQQNIFDQGIVNAGGVEVGMKFTSDVAGTVSGVRFFKGSQDTGAQTGELWSSTGQLLASATFTNETASGWQQVLFSAPVSISANTTYIVSYHSTSGYLAYTPGVLSSPIDNGPLHALSSGSSNGNDVYVYGSSAFPTVFNGQSANYWVDVVFQPAG